MNHSLTHSGLLMPNGDIDLGQHCLRYWFVARWHQAITWTNVDISFVRVWGIQLKVISQLVPKLLFHIMSLKIILLRLLPHLPGANGLNNKIWKHKTCIQLYNYLHNLFTISFSCWTIQFANRYLLLSKVLSSYELIQEHWEAWCIFLSLIKWIFLQSDKIVMTQLYLQRGDNTNYN